MSTELEWARKYDPRGIAQLLDENDNVVFEAYKSSIGKLNAKVSQLFKK